jgi:type IV pilus assembly protein PilQ
MKKPSKALQARAVHRTLLKTAAIAMLGLGAAWAHAQNAIQSITGAVQGGTEVVRIQMAEPLAAVPNGFTIQSPARIALDFPGVVNAVGRSAVELNQGNLRSANVVQAGDRTRLVINLKQPASYQASTDGRTLLVVLDRTEATAAAPAQPSVFAESRNGDSTALRDIDFRRGAGSTGRVVVELGSSQVGVDIRQQGQNLVVEFLRTSLPEGLSGAVWMSPTSAHRCRPSPRPRVVTVSAWWSRLGATGSILPTRATTSSCLKCVSRWLIPPS